ncbi:hypothetical protein SprV_0702372400 [Sparganum proliferum]
MADEYAYLQQVLQKQLKLIETLTVKLGSGDHQFHADHPGTSRMKSIPRSIAYWPGIDGDIVDLVRRCSPCQQVSKMPARQPTIHWQPPERPWLRGHIEFAGPLNAVSYLILVDGY